MSSSKFFVGRYTSWLVWTQIVISLGVSFPWSQKLEHLLNAFLLKSLALGFRWHTSSWKHNLKIHICFKIQTLVFHHPCKATALLNHSKPFNISNTTFQHHLRTQNAPAQPWPRPRTSCALRYPSLRKALGTWADRDSRGKDSFYLMTLRSLHVGHGEKRSPIHLAHEVSECQGEDRHKKKSLEDATKELQSTHL